MKVQLGVIEPSYAYVNFFPTCQCFSSGQTAFEYLVLWSDFHCKENAGTRAAHLIQTFLVVSPDIRRIMSLANYTILIFYSQIHRIYISFKYIKRIVNI